jgi:DNA-binding MarR family transcriptional regulator
MPRASRQPKNDAHPAHDVIQLLVAMSGRLSQHFAARAAEFGLSTGEGKLLLALEPGNTQSMRALARKLGYDASNLTGIVDKLEDRGAVERRADPSDRRVKAITATDGGRRLQERLSERLRADAGPVKALTDAQLRDLRKLLELAMTEQSAR